MLNQEIENKIINHFEQRTISPREEAWSKLELELDSPQKSTNKYRFLYSSAAAILIVIIAVIFIIKLGFADKKDAYVTSLDPIAKPNLDKVSTSSEDNLEKSLSTNVLPTNQKLKSSPQIKISNSSNQTINLLPTLVHEENQITEINSVESNEVANVNQNIVQSSTMDKIDPTLLLQQVESEIKTNKIQLTTKQSSKSYGVSAKNLLVDAEKESDKTFYSKVFKSVQEASGQIYTVVSNRNIAK